MSAEFKIFRSLEQLCTFNVGSSLYDNLCCLIYFFVFFVHVVLIRRKICSSSLYIRTDSDKTEVKLLVSV